MENERLDPMPAVFHHAEGLAEPIPMTCQLEGAPICVLDDDPSMLRAIDRLLKSAGFAVEKFSEPAAFLSAVALIPRRLAILDVWMPEMNGLEVQALLHIQCPHTRIIFMSGRDDPAMRQAALDAGAFAFLSKPFRHEVLLDFVRKANDA
jgi:two-component system response regulator HydG